MLIALRDELETVSEQRFGAVVASFVVRTKLLNVEPGEYWDG